MVKKITLASNRFMSPKEYAEYRGVHPNTVVRWIKSKKLHAEQPGGKGGHFFIPRDGPSRQELNDTSR